VNRQDESVRGIVPAALAYVQEPQLLPTSVLPDAQVRMLTINDVKNTRAKCHPRETES